MFSKTLIPNKWLLLIAGTGLLCGFLCLAARPVSQADRVLPAPSRVVERVPQVEPTPIPQPFPTTPPDASLITVGDPNIEGYATITGTAGAVEANAAVIVANLSARNFITTTADANGAFTTSLYAPLGSSLLIKYDPNPNPGDNRVNIFWQSGQGKIADATTDNINPLPGTILHVGQPGVGDGETQPFSVVGTFLKEDPRAWAGWAMTGTLQVPPGGDPTNLTAQRGQPITLTAEVRITSPEINCTGTPTYNVAAFGLGLRYMFDPDGDPLPWGNWFNSYLFTPTGLPIEHEASGEFWDGDAIANLQSLTCISEHAFTGNLAVTMTIPYTLPDGIYRPEGVLEGFNVPQSSDVPVAVVWYSAVDAIHGLPSLRVGEPAAPHIPWTLLSNYPVNGYRGVGAREDMEDYVLASRVLIPPHRVVIPRVDERTGEPIAYQLEPESYWVSGTERRLPNIPHIPLDLPSGELLIEVIKPDGSIDQLGPVPPAQSSVRTPTVPGGSDINEASGYFGDIFQLATMDEAFAYTFDQYGDYEIMVFGEVNDIYGNTYALHGTYDVTVARVLDIDPGQLPTTPYEQGNAFMPGVHLFPPVPADVRVELTQMPYSDPGLAFSHVITGQANRFGYFQPPPGTVITLTEPGEFRVDISAVYNDDDGTLWAGTITWGNVVEGPAAQIAAHGRRGLDYKDDTIDDMPAWFEVHNLPSEKTDGATEVYYPYFSGDVHWGDETPERGLGDSIHTIITVEDLTGPGETIYGTMRDHFPRATNCYRWPPMDCTASGLESRFDVGEAPLFITTRSGTDPAVAPEEIDLWGYWYGSSQRPGVRVREIIAEDGMGTAYWRFDDTYGYQIGVAADGDHPGEIKWEFGGVVFRTITETNPINEYAIYSSLWVLLPHNDPVGARITPPFRGAGDLDGGAILTMTVEGETQEIDVLFLPTGICPGDVLEIGDAIAFAGHVGPPLDSRVSVTITSPSGNLHPAELRANKIGWVYDPGFDIPAYEPGLWTVDVQVVHDRPYAPTGADCTDPLHPCYGHNTGTVMGTTGRYEFYVVEPESPPLAILTPEPGFVTWSEGEVEPIFIEGIAPAGTAEVRATIYSKGVVLGQGSIVPDASGTFSVAYDAVALNEDFSMISLTAHEGRWEGLADEVAISFLAVGDDVRAGTVTLIGEEVFLNGGMSHRVFLPLVVRDN